jgi:hypothetical protein
VGKNGGGVKPAALPAPLMTAAIIRILVSLY